jgi:sodium/potassium-transporting ATPase subunit alpha
VLLSIPIAIFLLGIAELRNYLLRRDVGWAARFLKWQLDEGKDEIIKKQN